jgi:hypothetical protein
MQRYQGRRNWGIILGSFAILLKIGLSAHPDWVEQGYSRGVFLLVRWLFSFSFSWIPFPVLNIFVGCLIFFVFRYFYRKRYQVPSSFKQRVFRFFMGAANFIGYVVFYFLFLWGYNYNRISIETQLGIVPKPLTGEELEVAFLKQTALLLDARFSLRGEDSSAFELGDFPLDLEDRLHAQLKKWLQKQGFPTPGRVRGRLLNPPGIFLRFSTAGLYFPFTGEGHADAGLHPLQWPAVLSHEMAHGYGFADEGTCNFLAYLCCVESKDPVIRYTGYLNHWRTLAVQYRRFKPQAFEELRNTLPRGVIADLVVINAAMDKYPDLIPHLQYRVYDAYLKSQGISEGMLNYDRVTILIEAWKKKNAN